ncbi:MAG: type II CAAX endopeptidase family protein [Gemmataceae bacterium]
MSDSPTGARRGHPAVAWLVIAGVVAFLLYRNATRIGHDDAAELVNMRVQGRLFVGMKEAGLPGMDGATLLKQLREHLDGEKAERHAYSKQLRLAVLAGELVGPKEALEDLLALERKRVNGDLEASPRSVEAAALLLRLYRSCEDGREPDLSASQQAGLRSGLGWFADLALAPEGGDPQARARILGQAYRSVFGFFALLLGGAACLFAGVALLIAFAYFAALGRLGGMAVSGRGGLYAEAFAAYMALYVGLNYGMRFLPEGWAGLWLSGVAMVLSLAALAWPVVRGVPWRVVRDDLGLHLGGQPLLEALTGVACYLCAVPVLAVGVLLIALLTRGQPSGSGPTHPVIGVALEEGWWVWAQVFVVACVLAPVVEEAMFRGALYRHLREAGSAWGRVASVAFAAAASGLVFAVIHPQGWLAVPALTGLAVVFALAREWRGTLLPPMVAHGINNGVITLMLLMMAG